MVLSPTTIENAPSTDLSCCVGGAEAFHLRRVLALVAANLQWSLCSEMQNIGKRLVAQRKVMVHHWPQPCLPSDPCHVVGIHYPGPAVTI